MSTDAEAETATKAAHLARQAQRRTPPASPSHWENWEYSAQHVVPNGVEAAGIRPVRQHFVARAGVLRVSSGALAAGSAVCAPRCESTRWTRRRVGPVRQHLVSLTGALCLPTEHAANAEGCGTCYE